MDKQNYKNEKYQVFSMFDKEWALATAGTIDNFNTCTIGWGSLGDIWRGINRGRPVVTIYVNPLRYTSEYLLNNDYFTVSFFPKEYKKDLVYLGRHSGRDEDKVSHTSLTPLSLAQGVTFKEAKLTFVCRKIYWDQFSLEHLDPAIVSDIYLDKPPHYEFIGEVIEVI